MQEETGGTGKGMELFFKTSTVQDYLNIHEQGMAFIIRAGEVVGMEIAEEGMHTGNGQEPAPVLMKFMQQGIGQRTGIHM